MAGTARFPLAKRQQQTRKARAANPPLAARGANGGLRWAAKYRTLPAAERQRIAIRCVVGRALWWARSHGYPDPVFHSYEATVGDGGQVVAKPGTMRLVIVNTPDPPPLDGEIIQPPSATDVPQMSPAEFLKAYGVPLPRGSTDEVVASVLAAAGVSPDDGRTPLSTFAVPDRNPLSAFATTLWDEHVDVTDAAEASARPRR
jgi:hypothetical protein